MSCFQGNCENVYHIKDMNWDPEDEESHHDAGDQFGQSLDVVDGCLVDSLVDAAVSCDQDAERSNKS